MRILQIVGLLLAFLAPVSLGHAANAWYRGLVARVAMVNNDGSFIVTFNNDELDDCQHKYAYFLVSERGLDWIKMAHAMALTSLTTGQEMGVVINKSVNGPGGQCVVAGMIDVKRGQ